VKDEDYVTSLNELRDEYDGFLVIALPNVFGITEKLGSLLTAAKSGLGKPVVAHIAESGITRRIKTLLEKAGIPVYPSPERAVRGLKALLSGRRGVR
jgi:acyl-CoA synthetase (NDP forming)